VYHNTIIKTAEDDSMIQSAKKLFLGRGFIWESNCKGIELVKNYIKAKHIVLMHIHHKEYGQYYEVATKLKNEFTSIKIFKNGMETKKYVFE
jgi:hypothetical protein